MTEWRDIKYISREEAVDWIRESWPVGLRKPRRLEVYRHCQAVADDHISRCLIDGTWMDNKNMDIFMDNWSVICEKAQTLICDAFEINEYVLTKEDNKWEKHNRRRGWRRWHEEIMDLCDDAMSDMMDSIAGKKVWGVF